MGAYRFFDNDSADSGTWAGHILQHIVLELQNLAGWQAIMAPHWQQTQQRMAALPVVLCLQDSTELDFNGQRAFGLGPLSYEVQRGMTCTRRTLSRPGASRWA